MWDLPERTEKVGACRNQRARGQNIFRQDYDTWSFEHEHFFNHRFCQNPHSTIITINLHSIHRCTCL